MIISTRGRYALRAMLALVKLGDEGKLVTINRISKEENLSPIFLEQIFFNLKKAGLVKSVRGPGGGFMIIPPLDKVTVKEVIEAAGEDIAPGNCDKHSPYCDRQFGCKSHKVWINFGEMIFNYFNNMTLASLLEDENKEMVNSVNEAC
ncbi:MAG: Rrf2 family transcriptional regulator [Treponema sp.]|nr:Rrf2 family transcriptional regulator [Treponema sp.]